jgi:MFS family permease
MTALDADGRTRGTPFPVARDAGACHPASRAYGASFWFAYAANAALMVAVSLLFRYADFVAYFGGSEFQLGLIVGVGMVGALAMRMVQGVGIDRYGPRIVWVGSVALFIVSLLCHLWITRIDGPSIFLVRVLLNTSIAGAFGASTTYISLLVPKQRVPEIVGTLGTSGFLGQCLGPMVGDYLFQGEITRGTIDSMFLTAAAISAVALVCAFIATRGTARPASHPHPPVAELLRRYHPGAMLLVAVAMGLGVGMPQTFLRAYARELHIDGIRVYFLIYAVMAFSVRLLTRRMAETHGVKAMVLLGLGTLALSMLLYPLASDEWTLAIPAGVAGFAHALLFPAVIGGGSISFPSRFRGLGATLMFAMFDLGNLVGQPAVGGILEAARELHVPAYPTMFLTIAATLLLVAGLYARIGESRPLVEDERIDSAPKHGDVRLEPAPAIETAASRAATTE